MTEGYNSTSLLWRVELGVGMVMGFQEVTGGKLSGWSRRDTWHENRLKKKRWWWNYKCWLWDKYRHWFLVNRKFFFSWLILFLAGNAECLQAELVKPQLPVMKAFDQKWFLGLKISHVLTSLFPLISPRLSLEVLNASRENGEGRVESQCVTCRVKVSRIFRLTITFTECLCYPCPQHGGGCQVKHDHFIQHFFPVVLGRDGSHILKLATWLPWNPCL